MPTTLQKVLIADDDEDDFELLRDAISGAYTTESIERVANGELLMNTLELNSPDILFLDINMPCKDGKQCLKEIRQNSRYDTLAVIMYTAVDAPNDIQYCYKQRANFYALKPSSFHDLQHIIKHILSIDWKENGYYPPLTNFVLSGNIEAQP